MPWSGRNGRLRLRLACPPLRAGVRSHVPLSDDELANELRAFAKRFAGRCTFSKAREMLVTGEQVHEYHNESDSQRYFELEATPLYEHVDERGPFVSISINANDMRPKGHLGSAWTPLTCEVYFLADGTVEFGPLGNLAASSEWRDF